MSVPFVRQGHHDMIGLSVALKGWIANKRVIADSKHFVRSGKQSPSPYSRNKPGKRPDGQINLAAFELLQQIRRIRLMEYQPDMRCVRPHSQQQIGRETRGPGVAD